MNFTLEMGAYHGFCAKNFSVNRPYGPAHYALVHFLRPMNLLLDGRMTDVEQGAFMIFTHGFHQCYTPKTPDMLENWCHFSCDEEESFENWARMHQIPFNRPFYLSHTEAIEAVFQAVLSDFYNGSPAAAGAGMEALFYCISSFRLTRQHNVGHEKKLLELRSTLRSRLSEKWDAGTMAAEVNYSPSYLNKMYRDMFGVSPSQDLAQMRMEYAKYLLCSTSYSVEQISQMLQYASSPSFISKFHAMVGISPLQYRKKHTAALPQN